MVGKDYLEDTSCHLKNTTNYLTCILYVENIESNNYQVKLNALIVDHEEQKDVVYKYINCDSNIKISGDKLDRKIVTFLDKSILLFRSKMTPNSIYKTNLIDYYMQKMYSLLWRQTAINS